MIFFQFFQKRYFRERKAFIKVLIFQGLRDIFSFWDFPKNIRCKILYVTGQSLLSCFRAKLLSCLIFPENVKKLVLYHFYQVTNHNFSIFISPNKTEILFDISSLKTLELQGFSQVCQSEKT